MVRRVARTATRRRWAGNVPAARVRTAERPGSGNRRANQRTRRGRGRLPALSRRRGSNPRPAAGREGRQPQRLGAGARREGPRTRVARDGSTAAWPLRQPSSSSWIQTLENRSSRGGESRPRAGPPGRRPSAGRRRSGWRRSGRYTPASACRPRPAARRSLLGARAEGGTRDRPRRGSRNRRLCAPGPDAAASARRMPARSPAAASSPEGEGSRASPGETAESGDGASPPLGLGAAPRPFRRLREEVGEVGGIRR